MQQYIIKVLKGDFVEGGANVMRRDRVCERILFMIKRLRAD